MLTDTKQAFFKNLQTFTDSKFRQLHKQILALYFNLVIKTEDA